MDEILQKLHEYFKEFLAAIPRIGAAIVIIALGVLLAKWFTSLFHKKIKHKSYDPLMTRFLAKTVKLIIFIGIFLLALHAAGLSDIAGAILGMAGAGAVVLGFAFKDIAENFLAGIILAFNRPFHVNDTVKIEEIFGKVKSMEFRYTRITTFDGRNVYIPNSDVLTKPVWNFTENGTYRAEFIIGISYEDDIEKAKQIITDCIMNDEDVIHDDNHHSFVAEDELAASTVNLKVYIWLTTSDFKWGTKITRGRILQKIKVALDEGGIYLPCNVTEVKLYEASKPFPVNSTVSQAEEKQVKAN